MKEVKCHWTHGTVLVCANERDPELGKSFCGAHAGVELRNWMKSKRNEDGLKGRVLVSVASCLGVCPKEGTVVAMTPVGGEPVVVIADPVADRELLWSEAKKHLKMGEEA